MLQLPNFKLILFVSNFSQEKLYEEAINILGPDRPVEPEDLPKLKYTEMVLKETVRIFPGAPVVYRAVKEDLKLGKPKRYFLRRINLMVNFRYLYITCWFGSNDSYHFGSP